MVLAGFLVTVRDNFLEGLTILFLARVCIGCVLAMGGGEACWVGFVGTVLVVFIGAGCSGGGVLCDELGFGVG